MQSNAFANDMFRYLLIMSARWIASCLAKTTNAIADNNDIFAIATARYEAIRHVSFFPAG
ncbi:MAG: hypothetical protein LBF85_04985 [Tannerella sp.]|nr:hypothetical protein [Tannerella sp.]